ncbi:testis-expressed protein 264 homolog [Periplaneta americana]|uniref:testis-expressed protein 264 homolog n=1 Tax=Periplaneta americana TaxID=6978 RepID=UPI0037E7A605
MSVYLRLFSGKMEFSGFWFIVFVITLVLTVITVLWWLGFFESIELKVGPSPFGKLVVVYKFNGVVPDNAVKQLMRYGYGITPETPRKSILISYYEKRNVSAYPRPKAFASGFILSEEGVLPNFDMVLMFLDMGCCVTTFPRVSHAVYTTYSYLDPFTKPMIHQQVFKKLINYIEHRRLCGHPAIEICNRKYRESTILVPLARQDDFYVPAAMMVPLAAQEAEAEADTSDTSLNASHSD